MFVQETLTGFKWMGNRAKDLLDQGKTVLFAFEEAIGMYTQTNDGHGLSHETGERGVSNVRFHVLFALTGCVVINMCFSI